MNLKIKAKGLNEEERRAILSTVKMIQRKRKRDNAPRLEYKIDFGEGHRSVKSASLSTASIVSKSTEESNPDLLLQEKSTYAG